ncbi:hypothetical protein XENOCAPTIV_030949 [Xenoophorus captivus]|uniref:Uncharacterized protein n=1 Tax=Xenoophorus captivus TaxID=1517983 RepID=A0ABV0Q419_9TELE
MPRRKQSNPQPVKVELGDGAALCEPSCLVLESDFLLNAELEFGDSEIMGLDRDAGVTVFSLSVEEDEPSAPSASTFPAFLSCKGCGQLLGDTPLGARLGLGVGLDLGAELYCLTCEENQQNSIPSSQEDSSAPSNGTVKKKKSVKLTLRVSQDSSYLHTLEGLGSPSGPLPVLLFPMCCQVCGLTLEDADLEGDKGEGEAEGDGGQMSSVKVQNGLNRTDSGLFEAAVLLSRWTSFNHIILVSGVSALLARAVLQRRGPLQPWRSSGVPSAEHFHYFLSLHSSGLSSEVSLISLIFWLNLSDADTKIPLFGRALRSEIKLDPLEMLGTKYKVKQTRILQLRPFQFKRLTLRGVCLQVNNMLDDTHSPRDFHSVVKPAIEDMMGREVTFDMLFHNSEHQATLFRYGVKKSQQVSRAAGGEEYGLKVGGG